MCQVFDSIADQYDRWYDTPEGEAIFRGERDCLLSLCDGPFDGWVDVGVGTGRFAHALGIPTGVDPSPNMLALAAARGIVSHEAKAEALPFAPKSFDGVLMALTLCFVADAPQVLCECRRVLRAGGQLLLGFVPADSPWGLSYQEKAAQGHSMYSQAHFRTATEVLELAQSCGFSPTDSASTLFRQPNEQFEPEPRIERGIVPGAGFAGLLFTLNQLPE
ncbi:MAG TPA: methyltransferase domain-containing protein [Candidatus Hydrogenedentes bacterium]|nr:methyltransferase domain-containing protein [Candidatus Hydrogenedentota bacterium]HPG69400.1 methyltransferase domain-containing protein [Candidatus Hydrogenedentota bacterium]